MKRRWQADGIPLWRKLFSSNWWWYGEVNPDPASLPPPEKRPKFWRGDVIFMSCLLFGMPFTFWLSAELNNRYWPFNHTNQYVGTITDVRFEHPQIHAILEDKSHLYIGLPQQDMLGLPRKKERPTEEWIQSINRLIYKKRECPQDQILFEIDYWKFTFKPFPGLWEVKCASTNKVLISKNEIIDVFKRTQLKSLKFSLSVFGSIGGLFLILIIRRERKRHVKS